MLLCWKETETWQGIKCRVRGFCTGWGLVQVYFLVSGWVLIIFLFGITILLKTNLTFDLFMSIFTWTGWRLRPCMHWFMVFTLELWGFSTSLARLRLQWAWSWTPLKQSWPSLVWGETLLFAACFLKKKKPEPSSRSLATRASCTIKRWRSYWRCCAWSTLWCQTCFTPLRPRPPSPLTSLIWNPSSRLWEEGILHSTEQLGKHSQCREKREGSFHASKTLFNFPAPVLLLLVEKFQEPVKQSFTCYTTAPLHPRRPPLPPSSIFSFKACSCVLLLL